MSAPSAAVFAPVLDRLAVDIASFLGTDRVRLAIIELQERPYSFIARMGVHREGEEQPSAHVFVKAIKVAGGADERERMRRRVAHEFDVTRRVFESMTLHQDVGVVPPIVCYPEHLIIATQQVEGVTLLDYMSARASRFAGGGDPGELAATMARTGRWLREFQASDRDGGPVTLEWFIDYIDIRLRRLVAASQAGFRESDRQRTLEHVEALWKHVDAGQLQQTAIHADLALSNVMVAGSRIIVLDFAMAKRGGPLHDLSRLAVQIELLAAKPHLRPATLRLALAALLQGFDPLLTRDSPGMRLYSLLHRLNHYGSLILKPSSFPTSWYNGLVRRQHRRWIEAELARDSAGTS